MDHPHPDVLFERAAVNLYLRRLAVLFTQAGEPDRAHDATRIARDLLNLVHIATAPKLRCSARTTAPTGEE